MDFTLSKEHEMARSLFKEFAENEVKPLAQEIDEEHRFPRETVEKTYDLEYGTATIEIHKDSIKPGERVVIVDDLIATGGTMRAAADLITELGGEVVKMLFLIELEGLNGRAKLDGYDVEAVVKYPGK